MENSKNRFFDSIKGGITKVEEKPDLEGIKAEAGIEALKATAESLGVNTSANTIKGIQDAIAKHMASLKQVDPNDSNE